MKEFDTIAAVSTSPGEGGISIIRVSGDNSVKLVSKIFRGKNGRKFDDIKSYTMRYGNIVDADAEEVIDEVIVSYMKGPRSFTAEDTVEINSHGGSVVTRRILDEVIKMGARLAEPGEFTKRAFLNGRIDLSQAEAVIDIIRAKTELSAKSAVLQAEGRISREIKKYRKKLLEIIAHIEATVDFPEEDLEAATSEQVSVDLNSIIMEIDRLIINANEGKIVREGLNTVIVGKPNVGKSSLMNALLEENRAIVTEIPGTTRDIIEEYINIDGIPVRLTDTAGIRESHDIVEKIGVEKSKEKIQEADLIIMMLDFSREIDEEDKEIINYIKDKKYIVLLNKSDLYQKMNIEDLNILNLRYVLKTSAVTSNGIDEVKKMIKELFFGGEIEAKDMFITNTRHKEALIRAKQSCMSAVEALKNTMAIDLASIDIRNAWSCLGEITGENLEEDIIDKIFSEFCLGK